MEDKIIIHELAKIPAIIIKTKIFPDIEILEETGRAVFVFPDNPSVKDAVRGFAKNEKFPIKNYFDLYRALHSQMMNKLSENDER
jgi:hypothetical protein